jgi:hypothetical protein
MCAGKVSEGGAVELGTDYLPFSIQVSYLKGPLEIIWLKCLFYRRGT